MGYLTRRVFFSFHYERDIWRVNQVRNSWVTKPDREDAGFWDASLWEEAKKKGDAEIRRMIDEGLKNTSVTVVLIGFETVGRKYVDYEIQQSHNKGNGMFGVYIHKLRNQRGENDCRGENPFGKFILVGRGTRLSDIYPTYDWVDDDGYNNFADWVEKATKRADR